ncbi:GFA family protein [Salipiger bermudensis]|uniref:GFA family protein n=1 Tax=Salipiger bermudensis TaxID=344736 RepID=UPI001CD5341E|nr:GFA family protein [Salipiger bermudensis]MCA1286595.1 GFA family protein [Salipiger bermudensis]
MPDLPAIGSCRCGALQVEVSAPPIMTAACHCRGCQKMSASAFSLTAMVPAAGFRVVSGTPVQGGIKGPVCSHFHCAACFAWVFTRITGMEDLVNIRPVMFDRPAWCEPFIETLCAEKLPWFTTPARHHFDGFPPEARFAGLMAEFADAMAGRL